MRDMWPTSVTPARRAMPARELLFKRDRPRAIDRYIDYFGDAPARPAARDVVDDVLLETSA